MKVTGIIAEYNPFHNGHQYQYQQILKYSEGSSLIVVMSGSFVQRGEPAVYDKYTRTRAALIAGADLVIELPAAFATSSAEDFAAAAVALLDQLGIVDELCFGSECGDIEALQELAVVLAREPEAYRRLLRTRISSGMSFPQARNAALTDWLSQPKNEVPEAAKKAEQWNRLLSSPNNILGLEYLKALIKRNSTIKPVTITRSGQGYHDTRLDDGFASASGIRALLSENLSGMILNQLPAGAAALYQQGIPVFADDCSHLLNERLLTLQHRRIPFDSFADISAELASRLEKQLLDFAPFSQRIASLKTRQYTYTRISRGLLHILLGIEKDNIAQYRSADYTLYARVLGFRKESAPLLSALKRSASIPLITKTAAARQQLEGLPLEIFLQDIYCTHIYQTIVHQKGGAMPRNEYTQPIILV